MELVWTQEALDCLDNIKEYLAVEKKSPQAAKAQLERIFSREDQIRDMPYSGHMVRDYQIESIREVPEDPYRIIYKVEDTRVLILAVPRQSRLLSNVKELQRALKTVKTIDT